LQNRFGHAESSAVEIPPRTESVRAFISSKYFFGAEGSCSGTVPYLAEASCIKAFPHKNSKNSITAIIDKPFFRDEYLEMGRPAYPVLYLIIL